MYSVYVSVCIVCEMTDNVLSGTYTQRVSMYASSLNGFTISV